MAIYAVLQGDLVTNVIVADTQNIAEEVTGFECIKSNDNFPAAIGYTYDRKWEVFVPAGMVYEPISKQILTPEEKAAL